MIRIVRGNSPDRDRVGHLEVWRTSLRSLRKKSNRDWCVGSILILYQLRWVFIWCHQIDIVSPDTLVIDEEFSQWEDSNRRIDLLGIDKDANLVVIEPKRTEDGGHMDLQSIRYAAMISAMTFERAVEVFTGFLVQNENTVDARSKLLEFLDWEEPDEDNFAQDVRIVLVSAEFSEELTTSVIWLNERGLEIECSNPGDTRNRMLL